jgi:hypothetical protein
MNITKTNHSLCLLAALAMAVSSATAGDVLQAKFESAYYKDFPQFHPYPEENGKKPYTISRLGPVGIGIELTLPAFGMKIASVEKGSPAEAAGTLKKGQLIESINGQTLKDIDPRVLLGSIITKAEATDGVVKLRVKESATAPATEVIVKIPVLGAYSKTWPLNCPKSDKIVRAHADYLAKTGNHASPGTDMGLLFMLSTGEEKDLEVARGWIKEIAKATKVTDYAWHIGYGGPALCEYYLRTGDATILPLITQLAENARQTMYNSGWAGRGGVPFNYMIGGHMNAAGVHVVTFLLLAKECGVNVDEQTLQSSLKQFFRYAGHGNTPYGDQMPEGGFVDNGKVGGLAFAMSAATSLTPEGEQSLYAKARDISAVKGFYSTSWMLHGHTGGGIGEIWRSSSMGLMADKKPLKYREFMDGRKWFYELSRRYDGSFGIVGGERYDGSPDKPGEWGIGLALTYTIPRKTLRITGAPATKYCKTYQLPKRPWGTEADDAFYSLVSAPDKNGKLQDVEAEKLITDASWPLVRKVNEPNVTDAVLLQYARHPDQNIREQTSAAIAKFGRDHLIVELLKDKDPRARHAGAQAIYGTFKCRPIPEARLTDEMTKLLLNMVNDPKESWWVVQQALMALSLAKPELLIPHLDRMVYWLQQDEWWLNTSAMFALTKVVADEGASVKVLPAVGDFLAKNLRVASGVGRGFPMDNMLKQLQTAKPEVKQRAAAMLAKAYTAFPGDLKVPGGVDLKPITDHHLDRLAKDMIQLPGGFDLLYTVSSKRFPNEALPHKDIFLDKRVKPASFGPTLKAAYEAELKKTPPPVAKPAPAPAKQAPSKAAK